MNTKPLAAYRTSASQVWLDLVAAGVPSHGYMVSSSPGRPGVAVITVLDGDPGPRLARIATALGAVGVYDVHEPAGTRRIEVQHLADVIDELTAEREAALAAGDQDTAHHKQDTIEAAHVLLHRANACPSC